MFNATAKMSQEASDVLTDGDCEELVDESFSFSADIFEKRTRRKRLSVKPPPSPRSPYLSSLNVNQRRAVAASRLPRSSLGDTRGHTPGESVSACFTSLSNGHDVSQTLRSECDVTSELLKQTMGTRRHKYLNSALNGFSIHAGDHREKEDMYDEIIRLKKSLHAQKSDNQQLKAKLRRLEEDNAKREKQIEELLDPTKSSEYTRSFVDKRKEGSVVVNGLKQRILKLEQQCREKENALSKLQSELRTSNLEELKITVETYSEEIKRLKVLLEAVEKSSRAESKCSQRQQKALNSTVHRLSEDLKLLQQENIVLREELNTDSPSGGVKGYREWSKQRLLRRLLEVEKRLEDSKRHTQSPKSSSRLDQEVQTEPTEIRRLTMATEAVVSVGTMTKTGGEGCDMRERLSQSEKEKAELEEKLSSKGDELKQLRMEKEELEKETELWKDEQTKERDKEKHQHKEELEQLWARIQTLEERSKGAQVELLSPSSASPEDYKDNKDEDTQVVQGPVTKKERATECTEGRVEDRDEESGADAEKREKEKAALVIQKIWRGLRRRDIVMLQSALRGHLLRESQLEVLLKDKHNKAEEASNCSDEASSTEAELDAVSLTMIQSAFRGHLARCEFAVESPELSVPSVMGKELPTLIPRRARSVHKPSRTGAASPHKDDEKHGEKENSSNSDRKKSTRDQTELCCSPESVGAAAVDSDDSDDIIMSPSRPMRRREVLLL